MASATYEKVFHEAQQLPPEERVCLADALLPAHRARVFTVRELQALLKQKPGQSRTLTNEERVNLDTWMEEAELRTDQIGAAWQDKDVSAADAVAEQRRER